MRLVFTSAARQPAHHSHPSILEETARSLLAVIFPSACSLCGAELLSFGGLGVCDGCWAEIREPWSGAACARCGMPFATELAAQASQPLCGPCRQGGYQFAAARSHAPYAGALRDAILHLKFGRRERLALELGRLLARPWQALPEGEQMGGAVLVPVPLHPSRRRERGFNQAELLAKGLLKGLGGDAMELNLRLELDTLKKMRPTPPQTGLSLAARRENVRGAFRVDGPENLRGRTVVLIDDVMTTGATLSACAEALRAGGAEKVFALTVARATPRFPDTQPWREDIDDSAPGRR